VGTTDSQKRDELRRGVDQRDTSITELRTQLNNERDVHHKNVEGIKEACRLIKGVCMAPRLQAEESRYVTEVKRLSDNLSRQREERRQLQSLRDAFIPLCIS
jgi:hypothetical protein